jgi:hypothetical protein
MNVRWLPIDPPWLIVPFIGGVVLAAVVVSNEGSLVAMWAAALVAIGSGTIGLDRWYERRHPSRPRR